MLPRWLLPGVALLPHPAPAASTVPAAPLAADSTVALSLGQALHRGTFGGHVRTVFMATLNHGTAPDYYAHGVGAGLRYETKAWHGLRLGQLPLASCP